jgi:hypothetical protein
MPVWKLNLIPFGFARLPMWVLAEDQALERPPAVTPAPRAVAATLPLEAPAVETAEIARVPPRPSGFQRFVDRFVEAIVHFGERS